MSETDLQLQIMNLVQSRGGYSINVMSASKDGVHDTIHCYKGRFLSIEVKIGKNQPSDLQLVNGLATIQSGGIAACVWDLETVKYLLDTLDEKVNLISTPKGFNKFFEMFKQTPKLPRL